MSDENLRVREAAGSLDDKPIKYFEDYRVGDVIDVDAVYPITEDEIVEVGRRWDPQPFHTDADAARESFFGGLVASSVHLFAASVWLGYQMDVRTAAVSALGFKELRWHAPARPGDGLKARSTTLSARISKSRPDCGVVENGTEIFNQRGELVFSFTGAALIRRRQTGAP